MISCFLHHNVSIYVCVYMFISVSCLYDTYTLSNARSLLYSNNCQFLHFSTCTLISTAIFNMHLGLPKHALVHTCILLGQVKIVHVLWNTTLPSNLVTSTAISLQSVTQIHQSLNVYWFIFARTHTHTHTHTHTLPIIGFCSRSLETETISSAVSNAIRLYEAGHILRNFLNCTVSPFLLPFPFLHFNSLSPFPLTPFP